MALSPKSNTAHVALDEALDDIYKGNVGSIPNHIKTNSPLYKYPHDYPGHFTSQQYLPSEIQDERFWHAQHSPNEEKLYNWMVTCWGDRFKE